MPDTKGKFQEFVSTCSRLLKGESLQFLELIKKRYNSCAKSFRDSLEMVELLDVTTTKLLANPQRIFVHLKDFTTELKAWSVDSTARTQQGRKRKAQDALEAVSKACKVEDSLSEGSDVEGKLHRAIGSVEGKATSGCVADQTDVVCVSEVSMDDGAVSRLDTAVSSDLSTGGAAAGTGAEPAKSLMELNDEDEDVVCVEEVCAEVLNGTSVKCSKGEKIPPVPVNCVNGGSPSIETGDSVPRQEPPFSKGLDSTQTAAKLSSQGPHSDDSSSCISGLQHTRTANAAGSSGLLHSVKPSCSISRITPTQIAQKTSSEKPYSEVLSHPLVLQNTDTRHRALTLEGQTSCSTNSVLQATEGTSLQASSVAMLSEEQPSCSSQTDSNMDDKTERHVQKLEKLLKKLHDEIESVREKDLSLDDMDEADSSYLYEDRLQKKFVKVWNRLCQLKGRTTASGRPVERKFKYDGSRFPEINRKIQKFVNRPNCFPDFHDILGIVKKVNTRCRLGLSVMQINDISRETFLDVGNALQKRRQEDLISTFHSKQTSVFHVAQDPARFDDELQRKLESNSRVGKTRMEEVLSKYSNLQMELGPDDKDEDGNKYGDDTAKSDPEEDKESGDDIDQEITAMEKEEEQDDEEITEMEKEEEQDDEEITEMEKEEEQDDEDEEEEKEEEEETKDKQEDERDEQVEEEEEGQEEEEEEGDPCIIEMDVAEECHLLMGDANDDIEDAEQTSTTSSTSITAAATATNTSTTFGAPTADDEVVPEEALGQELNGYGSTPGDASTADDDSNADSGSVTLQTVGESGASGTETARDSLGVDGVDSCAVSLDSLSEPAGACQLDSVVCASGDQHGNLQGHGVEGLVNDRENQSVPCEEMDPTSQPQVSRPSESKLHMSQAESEPQVFGPSRTQPQASEPLELKSQTATPCVSQPLDSRHQAGQSLESKPQSSRTPVTINTSLKVPKFLVQRNGRMAVHKPEKLFYPNRMQTCSRGDLHNGDSITIGSSDEEEEVTLKPEAKMTAEEPKVKVKEETSVKTEQFGGVGESSGDVIVLSDSD